MAIKKEIEIVLDADKATADAKKFGNTLEGVDKEAKKVNESVGGVADNGGAIAILDSLTGGLATTLKDAYEASKLFNFSLKATRGALIATGIGAFVVALGLVVAYWDEIGDFITGANTSLEDQINLIEKEATALDRNLKILEDTDNILKLQGLSQSQINDLKRIELNKIIDIRTQELLLAKERLEGIKEQAKAGIGSVEQIFRYVQERATAVGFMLDKVFGAFGVKSGLADKAFEATGSAIESLFGTREEFDEATDRINKLTDQINNAKNQIAGFDLQAQEEARKRQEEIDKRPNVQAVGGESEGFDLFNDPEILFEEGKAERLKQINAEILADQLNKAQQRLLQEEVIANARVGLEENTFGLLRNIAEQGSALSKAVAIADVVREQVRSVSGIISNTGIANAKAVAASPLTAGQPWVTLNTVGAGLGIAASIAGAATAIKDITSNKKSVGGGSFSGGGGGGVSAPSFNLVEGSGTNQIAQGLQGQDEPVRAYVVSGDVTTSQSLERNIQGDASLG